ncbi:MAG: molybdopterin-dependent oxidoreductase, partial [Myxococcaceae bacterium]
KGLPKAPRRTVLLPRLGDEVLAATDPPIRMAYVAGANPASMAPRTGRVLEALRSLEFVVVVDQFMSATAGAAHLVLPCTTYLEADDLVTAYGHNWIGLTQRVVAPSGEARTDGEILQGLAGRLGFGQALEGSAEEWLERLLAPLAKDGVTLASLRERPRRRPNAVAVPFADRVFTTKSGKVELVAELPPTAPIPAGELRLVSTKTLHLVNSQVLPEHVPDEPVARVHGETLRALGLRDGDYAWVESKAARVKVRLAADPTVRRDVLLFNPTLWKDELSGVNQLREAHLTDAGEGAAMHETTVTVRR